MQKRRKRRKIKERKELNERIQREEKMLVPDNQQQRKNGHVISMYLATCGTNGHLLGSDEKEIIYLVFGIIDLLNKEVSDFTACVPLEKFLKNMFFSQLRDIWRKKKGLKRISI